METLPTKVDVPKASSKTRPAQVDCFPFPSLEEYLPNSKVKNKGAGIYYDGIYICDGALEEYAKRVNPEADDY